MRQLAPGVRPSKSESGLLLRHNISQHVCDRGASQLLLHLLLQSAVHAPQGWLDSEADRALVVGRRVMQAEQIATLHSQVDREQGDVLRFAYQHPAGTPAPLCLNEAGTTKITQTSADHHGVRVDAPCDPLRCRDLVLLPVEGHPGEDMNGDRQSAVYTHFRTLSGQHKECTARLPQVKTLQCNTTRYTARSWAA